MKKSNFLIYGSYGYSGNLIATLARDQGLKPTLGGRNKQALIKQSNLLDLDYQCFDLADLETTKAILQNFTAVIHCAGPFINTYQPMAQACMATQTHYLDITGEYDVIEKLSNLNQQAIESNTMLLSGAGFDVVPTDCLAFYLKHQLPDATHLTLAIHSSQNNVATRTISRGTAKTILQSLGDGSLIRSDGSLKSIPLGSMKRAFDFGTNKPISCTTIPWGDLTSAWWSTGIPNIEVYISTTANMITLYKLLNPLTSLLKWSPLKQIILKRIDKMPAGPGKDELEHSIVKIYGEVNNQHGNKKAALIETPNGYKFTAAAALLIVNKILSGNAPIGFQTPATAYGEDLVLEIAGTRRIPLQ